MGILDFLRGPDINQGVQEYNDTPGAVLLDVRSSSEYEAGHVPGSRNMPVNQLARIAELVPDKETPIFSYCLSGARSQRAVAFLKKVGYTNAKNIGAITDWKGEIKRP